MSKTRKKLTSLIVAIMYALCVLVAAPVQAYAYTPDTHTAAYTKVQKWRAVYYAEKSLAGLPSSKYNSWSYHTGDSAKLQALVTLTQKRLATAKRMGLKITSFRNYYRLAVAIARVKVLLANEARLAAVNVAAAKIVTDLIIALPATLTLAHANHVIAARTAYMTLTAAQKLLVLNLSVLTAAEAKMVELNSAMTVTSIKALTTTTVEVKLSKAVDAITAANFSIVGIAVNAATLGTDKMTVTLTVAPLKPLTSYEVTIKDVKVNAVAQPTIVKTLAVPDVSSLYKPTLVASKEIIKADGASQAIVTFSLKDALGTVITDAKNVEVSFTTTFGQFAQNRVVLQNGEAKLLFTSEFLTANKVADLRAVVIEAQDTNLIGLKAEASIILSPNPDTAAIELLGASMTGAESNQADRVTVYFNKDVTVAQYVNATTGAIDSAKAVINVYKNAIDTTGTMVAVKGLLPVDGNKKALQILLDVETSPANALMDNANVFVAFNDKTGTVDVARTATFKLTDARKPAMLSVATESLNKLIITFSEPVDSATAMTQGNWSIDGTLISAAALNADVTVGVFNRATGTDSRNVVTIKLGAGNYFTAGTHSVQASNVGDWAKITDPANIMNTQTLDFTIAADSAKPVASVEVMSPEQWLVTFNRDVPQATLINPELILQVLDPVAGTWSQDTMDSNLLITKIPDNKFLVEVKQDWTIRHNTNGTLKNYFNYSYRLKIAANAVMNPANGQKNDEQLLTLGGAMLTPDTTSPVIADIVQVTAGTLYKAVMSEPVKMVAPANDETTTLAQSQAAIPAVTASFIKADYSKTILGTVATGFADVYDKEISVAPVTPLEAGNWILVVRSISDDIGNTAASATKQFTVAGTTTPTDSFKVTYATADLATATSDLVYVQFNKAIKTSGGITNALTTTNYTLDGAALPIGTQIIANWAGDITAPVLDSITIVLPNGALGVAGASHVLNISNTITSYTDEALTNGGEKSLPFGTAPVLP